MKIAIMQPYFLPYIGYFQLLTSVDKFILLDDVNYIKGGWINRNRILNNNEIKWLTIPLAKSSPNKFIQEIDISSNNLFVDTLLRQVKEAYKNAPYFYVSYQLIEKIIQFPERNLSRFLFNALTVISDWLEIQTRIEQTSSIYPKNGLRSQARILDICLREKATSYINLPGGRDLYDPQAFKDNGIDLYFLEPVIHPYNQHTNSFVPYLSILDVLMWNSHESVRAMIRHHKINK